MLDCVLTERVSTQIALRPLSVIDRAKIMSTHKPLVLSGELVEQPKDLIRSFPDSAELYQLENFDPASDGLAVA